jgi:hypothetical protein
MALRQMRGRVDLLVGFLDQDAGRLQPRTGVGLGFDDGGLQTAIRRGSGAHEPGETCSDDDEVERAQGLSAQARSLETA